MIDRSVADITPWQAVALSVALLVGGWIFYDQLCKRLGLEHEALAVVMIAFFAAVAWGLSHVFSGRAMYLQIGAMIGTIMAWNVYFVIMPAQRKLVEAKERDVAPDPVYGLHGKQRSVHNNYFTLPVLFIMISNHYPMTFGSPARVARADRDPAARRIRPPFFQPAAQGEDGVGDSRLGGASRRCCWRSRSRRTSRRRPPTRSPTCSEIVAARCATCHAAKPTQPGFNDPPKGFAARHAGADRRQRAKDQRAGGGDARRCRSAT